MIVMDLENLENEHGVTVRMARRSVAAVSYIKHGHPHGPVLQEELAAMIEIAKAITKDAKPY